MLTFNDGTEPLIIELRDIEYIEVTDLAGNKKTIWELSVNDNEICKFPLMPEYNLQVMLDCPSVRRKLALDYIESCKNIDDYMKLFNLSGQQAKNLKFKL